MDYDLKITGGSIIDGTGKPAFDGDVGIRDGRVVALGAAPGSAARTVDAAGLVVAPGFVDPHTHYDAQLMWDRMLSISPWHGVTTVVMGNCGFSVAPTRADHRGLIMRTLEKVEGMNIAVLEAGLGYDWPFETFPQYLDAVEKHGTAINTAAMVGHTAIRLYVMGLDSTERAATADEITAMRALVRESLKAGAIGFATSKGAAHIGFMGRPVPSRAASLDEVKALAGVMRELDSGVMQITQGRGLSFNEFAELADETRRTITWTAIFAGDGGPSRHREALERSHAMIRRGLAVVPQITDRPLFFEQNLREPFIFESISLFRPVSAADAEGKKRIYADPAFREKFRQIEKPIGKRAGWDKIIISWCPTDHSLEERSVAEVAHERGVHPVDLCLDLSLASNLEARFRAAIANTNEDDLRELLLDPCTLVSLSDAGAHASQLCDACYSTYLLGHWVRENQAFSLEEGVRMLTSRPAQVFGITDRGRLAAGMPADVVLFDPRTIGAGPLHRIYDLPTGADRLVSDATGIEAVIVNGTIIRQGGKDVVDAVGPLPGKVLRHGHASA